VTHHVALTFPGRRYGAELPVLRYPAQALRQAGADVVMIDCPAALVSLDAPSATQWDDAMRTITQSVTERIAGASQVTLLAKSLGTRVLGRLPEDLLPANTDALWLTPIFADPDVAEAASRKPWRSLYVYGTADAACADNAVNKVAAKTGGAVLSIARGDHSLEVEGDVRANVDALVRLTDAVVKFVDAR
jgi:hypothetical protein